MSRNTLNSPPAQAVEVGNEGEWPYEVLKRFRLIFKAVQQHSQWVETRCGVTSPQLWALWELSLTPGMRVSDLAKVMSIHHSTASNMLDKLAKKGLVRRERASEDQRVVTLQLTQEGVETVMQAPLPAQGILQHALFQLPEAALQCLAKDLDALIKAMKIRDDAAALQPLNPLAKTQ